MCEPGYAQKLVGQAYTVSGCSDLNPAFRPGMTDIAGSVMIDNRQMNSIQQLAFEVNKQGKIYRQTLPVILLRTPVKANTFLLFSEVLFTGT